VCQNILKTTVQHAAVKHIGNLFLLWKS